MRIRRTKAKYTGNTEQAQSQLGAPTKSYAPQTPSPRLGWGSTQAPLGGMRGAGRAVVEDRTHHPQQAADLIDSTNAAQEAHEHGEAAHANEDIRPRLERGGRGFCGWTRASDSAYLAHTKYTKPGQVCYQIPALGSGSGVGHPAGSPFLHQLWKLPPLDVRPTPHLSYPHLPTVPLSFFSLALTRIEKTLVLPACLAHCLLSPQACERHEGRDSSPC